MTWQTTVEEGSGFALTLFVWTLDAPRIFPRNQRPWYNVRGSRHAIYQGVHIYHLLYTRDPGILR
jgi:hypothetical protein